MRDFSLNFLVQPFVFLEKEIVFNDVINDSRMILPNNVFLSVLKKNDMPSLYIKDAVKRGAVAIVMLGDRDEIIWYDDAIPMIYLTEQHLYQFIYACYPLSKDLCLIGVTGTNGKTSVTFFCAQLWQMLGKRSAVIGTVGYGELNALLPTPNTTLDFFSNVKLIYDLEQKNIHHIAMEISSHGLVQKRIGDFQYQVSVFTNLSRDHLDYHGTFLAYKEAKKQLFLSHSNEYAIFNIDDEVGRAWYNEFKTTLLCYSYSLTMRSDIKNCLYFHSLSYHAKGISGVLCFNDWSYSISLDLYGAFNVANLLASMLTLYVLGYALEDMIPHLSFLKKPLGRMEFFTQAHFPTVIVDYAHTPEALRLVLNTLRLHYQSRIWCIFGCGGQRDKGKRPIMARYALENADYIIITEDNSRDELFSDIVEDMQLPDEERVTVIKNREHAINYALRHATIHDVILLAGKGHETYQMTAVGKVWFSDREYVVKKMNDFSRDKI